MMPRSFAIDIVLLVSFLLLRRFSFENGKREWRVTRKGTRQGFSFLYTKRTRRISDASANFPGDAGSIKVVSVSKDACGLFQN